MWIKNKLFSTLFKKKKSKESLIESLLELFKFYKLYYIISGILSIIIIPTYSIFLFHSGIYSFFDIPSVFLEIDFYWVTTTSHYFLMKLFTYLLVFFPLLIIYLSLILYSIRSIFFNEKHHFINTLFLISITVLFGSWYFLEIFSLDNVLYLSGILSILMIIEFFNKNSLLIKQSIFGYSILTILIIIITSCTNFFITSGKLFAEKNLNTHTFSTIEIDKKKYILFFTGVNDNIVAKEVTNNIITRNYYLLSPSSLFGKEIKEESLPKLKK